MVGGIWDQPSYMCQCNDVPLEKLRPVRAEKLGMHRLVRAPSSEFSALPQRKSGPALNEINQTRGRADFLNERRQPSKRLNMIVVPRTLTDRHLAVRAAPAACRTFSQGDRSDQISSLLPQRYLLCPKLMAILNDEMNASSQWNYDQCVLFFVRTAGHARLLDMLTAGRGRGLPRKVIWRPLCMAAGEFLQEYVAESADATTCASLDVEFT